MKKLRQALYHVGLLGCIATAPAYAFNESDVTDHIILKLQNNQAVTQEVLDQATQELHLPIGLTFVRPMAGNNYTRDLSKCLIF